MSFFHYSIVTGRNSSLDMKAGKLLNKTGFEKTIVDEEPVVRKNDNWCSSSVNMRRWDSKNVRDGEKFPS